PSRAAGGPRDAVGAVDRQQGGRLRQPVTVRFRGGTYALAEPLVLTPEDSGTAEAPVTYAAAPGERPVLSGGRPVGGWKEVTVDGKRLWAADLPEGRAGRWSFSQPWVGDQRRPRPPHPHDRLLRIEG